MYTEQPREDFDKKLAVECASAFSDVSDLGCAISNGKGRLIFYTGYSCGNCRMCSLAGIDRSSCVKAHIYGMTEAERFGGKYIYFCPMGFNCFVSPVLGEHSSSAMITVGPFLMVEKDDYTDTDLSRRFENSPGIKKALLNELKNIPCVSPGKVNSLSTLLFMAVGFMNNVSAASRMLETQELDSIQGQIGEYIRKIKFGGDQKDYPIATEKKLLDAISSCDKSQAGEYLNELLGYIFFSCGGDFATIKSSVSELLVLISRAAIDGGANCKSTLLVSRKHLAEINRISNIDELCNWLTKVMNELIDSVFVSGNMHHTDVIYKAVYYMKDHLSEKLTLEETSGAVYLSPTYFSKIFKAETGCSWSSYLNRLRIDKSKMLLVHSGLKISDIAAAVGFEEQSYYTKVFKKLIGISPSCYRDRRGHI